MMLLFLGLLKGHTAKQKQHTSTPIEACGNAQAHVALSDIWR